MGGAILAGGVHSHCHVHDGVNPKLSHQLSDHRVARVGMHEVHVLERAHRVRHIAPEQVWDLGCEATGHLGSKRIGDTGDENAARNGQGFGGHPLPIIELGLSRPPGLSWRERVYG